MRVRILTANTSFGLPKMNSIWWNLYGHFGIHGWIFPFLPIIGKYIKLRDNPKRLKFISKNSNLKTILNVIKKQHPNIIILNELIFQTHKEEIEKKLKLEGFNSFAWGKSAHHNDATVCTLAASKLKATDTKIKPLTQINRAGSGGGTAGLKINNSPIIIIGLHLSSCYPNLWKQQILEIAEIIKKERKAGNEVIVAGDFNATEENINSIKRFKILGLKSVNNKTKTCPTCQILGFPKMKILDHIFVSKNTKITNTKSGSFESDHLWLSVDITRF
ncbi:MAG: endonuclease/exonuclease/phosphatase family protein [Candidatus Pacebacteria bacterium]|nr:endonuclease/exonuclease/phosphatase family protein [Candidatus Paceibacterota bacterium]